MLKAKSVKSIIALLLVLTILLIPAASLAAAPAHEVIVSEDGIQRTIHYETIRNKAFYFNSVPPATYYYEYYNENYGCYMSGNLTRQSWTQISTINYVGYYSGRLSGGTV